MVFLDMFYAFMALIWIPRVVSPWHTKLQLCKLQANHVRTVNNDK